MTNCMCFVKSAANAQLLFYLARLNYNR